MKHERKNQEEKLRQIFESQKKFFKLFLFCLTNGLWPLNPGSPLHV